MSEDEYKDPFLNDDIKKDDEDLVEETAVDATDNEEDDEGTDLLWDTDEEE